MSHESFLAEIINNPDDDTPRLIYADWLEEQGDPRSEFIRLQCEIASRPSYDPALSELREQEQRFLDQHAPNWSKPVLRYAQNIHYERGLISKVTLRLSDASDRVHRISRLTPLQKVKLIQVSKGRMIQFIGSPELGLLSELDFSNEQLGPQVMKELASCEYLDSIRALRLSKCQLNHASIKALTNSPALRNLNELYLDSNRIDGRGINSLVNSSLLKNLKKIDLTNNPLESADLALLLRQGDLKNLESLYLHGLEDNEPLLPLAEAELPNLKHLQLAGPQAGLEMLEALHNSTLLDSLNSLELYPPENLATESSNRWIQLLARQDFSNLQFLKIQQYPFRGTNIEKLLRASWFHQLMNFNLPKPFNGLELQALSKSAALNSQRTLVCRQPVKMKQLEACVNSTFASRLIEYDVRYCELGDDLLRVLSANQSPITGLKLSHNPLGDTGLKILVTDEAFQQLQELELCRTHATEAGWLTFFELGNFPDLHSLNVQGNRLSSAVVQKMIHWKHAEQIKSLVIHTADVSASCYRQLQQRFPGLAVYA